MRIYKGQAYKTVAIIGSFRKQLQDIARAKEVFEANGFEVLVPVTTKVEGSKDISFVRLETDGDKPPRILEKNYVNALQKADIVYCFNTNGYIGGSVMFELGYLIAKGAEVYFLEKPSEELIEDLITNKDNIISPESLCEKIKLSNQIWQSRDWFDSHDAYTASFAFNKKPDFIQTKYINGKPKTMYGYYDKDKKDYIIEETMENQ